MELDTLFRDVASVLSEKCINPESNRPCAWGPGRTAAAPATVVQDSLKRMAALSVTAADTCCLARLLLGPPGLWTRCLVALHWPTIQVPSLPADTISMLERALKDVHFSVDPKRPAKAQALEVGRVHGSAAMRCGLRVAISACSRGLNDTCRWHMPPARRRFTGWPVSSAGPQFPGAAAAEEPVPN